MDTSDVYHRLLSAPLAVFDEDIEDNTENLRETTELFDMNDISYSKTGQNSINHNNWKTARRVFRHRKPSSVVVLNPALTLLEKHINARIVRIRLVFIRIGEIDTLNEKYQADIYFEARWTEKRMNINTSNLTSQQQTQLLHDNMTVRLNELNSIVQWSPQLFIENAIGQIGEQDRWFTIKKALAKSDQPSLSTPFVNFSICEHRRIKGVFWEKLELNHFPADVQDLTVSISSHHQIENCVLVQDEHNRSIINREAFFDQQEWSLYEHVATERRETKEEYSFEDESSGMEQNKHPVLAIACRAARQPGYYYWNGFCLIFLITLCSFCIFSISPDLPQSRLQITCTLLLTSVTFRWVVNRSLPQISYLTTLDIYAIVSIIILIVLCIWHSIIATIIYLNPISANILEPTHRYVLLDRYVFIGLFVIYFIIHIALIVWLIHVPYKRRREMEYLDREYAEKKYIQLDTSQSLQESKQSLVVRRSSTSLDVLPPIKSVRTRKQSEGVTIIPNASLCVPIQEETTTKNGMNIIELGEQDDEYYNNKHDINNELKSTQMTPVEKL